MSKQQSRFRVLIANAIAAIFAILVFGLITIYAKPSEPTPFLSPTGNGLTPRAWLPVVMNNFPLSVTTTSYYVKYYDQATMTNLGCTQGQSAIDYANIAIVLDVGEPDYEGNNYGAYGWDAQFHSTTDISNAIQTYLINFYNCAPPHTELTLAIGVNNEGPQVGSAHGMAWAQMINSLNSWLYLNGISVSKLTVRGGMDIEQSFPFQYPGPTRAWTDGYTSAFVPPSYYFNFGSCDGCPSIAPCPTCVLTQSWTIEDVWYVSYYGAAVPLPDIYNSTNAAQWYQMSLYSVNYHNYRMNILGPMTEYGACQQRGCVSGFDNTPSAGYSELYSALNANPSTAQSLPWLTDIQWLGEPIKYPNP